MTRRWQQMDAIVSLRYHASAVIVLCDRAIYGTRPQAQVAKALLRRRLQALQNQVARTQAALEEGDA
jgi:hypothetical protein